LKALNFILGIKADLAMMGLAQEIGKLSAQTED
jgi:hypothetical protein